MEAATLSSTAKSEFRNDSGGTVGVIVIDNGKERALPVHPGDTAMLTAQEQMLTANAPKRAEDNPFTNGNLTLVTPAREMANRRPIGDASTIPGAQPDPIAEAKAREEAEAAAAARRDQDEARKAEEAARRAEATKQAQTGAQPRTAPPAGPASTGAEPVEETGNTPRSAAAEGKRAAGEEVATPEAKP